MYCEIPKELSFKTATDLIRVGKVNDGGYLVSRSDIDNTDLLLGFGVNDDWSFEEKFKSIADVEVIAYDGSVGYIQFLKQFAKAILKFYAPKVALHWLKTIIKYHLFFSSKSNHHIKKYVGLDTKSDAHCSLAAIFINTPTKKNIFLKVDIEGSEYRLLDTLISHQSSLSGMVIEFHDCDVHLETIKKFIKNFDLQLVHVHANNCAPVRVSDKLPIVLELSFSRHAKLENEALLPHPLDMPNDNKVPEILLLLGS